jgi:hypothetical protein
MFVQKAEFQINRMVTEFDRIEELNGEKIDANERKMSTLFNDHRKKFEYSLVAVHKELENLAQDTSISIRDCELKLVQMETYSNIKDHVTDKIAESKNLMEQRIKTDFKDLKDCTRKSLNEAVTVKELIGPQQLFKSLAEFISSAHESISNIPYIEDKLEAVISKEIVNLKAAVEIKLEDLKPDIMIEMDKKYKEQCKIINIPIL